MGIKFDKINRINSILNEFLEEFDCTADFGTDFCYYPGFSEINYSLAVSSHSNRLFLQFLKAEFPTIKADVFLWSFLHELGHHETIDDLTEWEDKYSHDSKKIICEALKFCPKEEYDDIYSSYFSLPDEFAATSWAATYMLKNIDKISSLWEKLAPEIAGFYLDNNLVIDNY